MTQFKNTDDVFGKTEVLTKVIKKVAEKKSYKVGDQVKAYSKDCKIVEALEEGRFHLKNLQEPYDSFVVLEGEFE